MNTSTSPTTNTPDEMVRWQFRLRNRLLTCGVAKTGAAGYLTKESVPEELKEAVRKVVAGGRYVSATLAEKLAVDLRAGADTPLYELLSDREFQVLRMIASGKSVKDIAEELSLSVKTVSTYRARVLEKSGMKTNAELIRYALQSQLVD